MDPIISLPSNVEQIASRLAHFRRINSSWYSLVTCRPRSAFIEISNKWLCCLHEFDKFRVVLLQLAFYKECSLLAQEILECSGCTTRQVALVKDSEYQVNVVDQEDQAALLVE